MTVRTAWTRRLSVSHVTPAPSARAPRHSHPEKQASVVLTGMRAMTIGDGDPATKARDCFLIPRTAEHGGQAGPEGAFQIDAFLTARADYK